MAQMIGAVASLAWPVLIVVVLLMFRRPITGVIRSAEHRGWSLEVGGQKLYTSAEAVAAQARQALGAGATAVTSSPVVLLKELRAAGLLDSRVDSLGSA